MTAPRPTRDVTALLAALDTAAETITALANCIGREDYAAEKRAMAKVDDWNKLRRLLPDPEMRRAA